MEPILESIPLPDKQAVVKHGSMRWLGLLLQVDQVAMAVGFGPGYEGDFAIRQVLEFEIVDCAVNGSDDNLQQTVNIGYDKFSPAGCALVLISQEKDPVLRQPYGLVELAVSNDEMRKTAVGFQYANLPSPLVLFEAVGLQCIEDVLTARTWLSCGSSRGAEKDPTSGLLFSTYVESN